MSTVHSKSEIISSSSLPLQRRSHIQSAAAQHLQCPPSTWRHHPSPAASRRALFLLNPGYRSVLFQLVTDGSRGRSAAHPEGCSGLFYLSATLIESWEASKSRRKSSGIYTFLHVSLYLHLMSKLKTNKKERDLHCLPQKNSPNQKEIEIFRNICILMEKVKTLMHSEP